MDHEPSSEPLAQTQETRWSTSRLRAAERRHGQREHRAPSHANTEQANDFELENARLRSEVRTWDAPVVHALDMVEALPGFAPGHVEWDCFRFYGANSRWRMDYVTIWAYPLTDAGPSTSSLRFVRFAATGAGLVVTDMAHREMRANEVARVLAVPTGSAEQAITTIGHGLNDALIEYNTAHDPRSRTHQQTPARYARGPALGLASTTAGNHHLDEENARLGPERDEQRDGFSHALWALDALDQRAANADEQEWSVDLEN